MGVHTETLADRSTLSAIRRQIRAALNEVGAPTASAFDCLVAVTEACTNALLHGQAEGAPAPEVRWEVTTDIARFEITDFSGREGAEPPPQNEIPRDGGFGLQLMRQLMDDVDIRFSPSGTTVSMEKSFA